MREEDLETIDLLKLLEIAKKRAAYFAAIVILFATIAYLASSFLITKTYSATATVIIVQKNDGAKDVGITYSDVQFSQKLVNTYIQILRSEVIGESVIANLDLYEDYGIDASSLNNMVDIAAANNTEVMNITVTTNDPKLSAQIANEMVTVFQKKLLDIMAINNITILNSARVPLQPSGPNVWKNTVIAALFGAVLCGVYAVYVLLTDTKVKSEEDVKKIFDYPIIGVIPEFKVEDVNDYGEASQ